MDIILSILQSLGADKSFFYQFIIFTITYLIAAPLFMKTLLNVLMKRNEVTVGVMEKANRTMNKSLKLEEDYNVKKSAMKKELFDDLQLKKSKLLESKKQELSKLEFKLESELENKKATYNIELNEKRDAILDDAKNISKELVDHLR